MQTFIPLEKRSKKAQKAYHRMQWAPGTGSTLLPVLCATARHTTEIRKRKR